MPVPRPKVERRAGETKTGIGSSLSSVTVICPALQAKLNNLRPLGRFTRDLFSRTRPAAPRKSLIFLDLLSAAASAVSDNGQSVNFQSSAVCYPKGHSGGWPCPRLLLEAL